MLAPLGRMKKLVNLVLGLFLILSMLVPVVSLFKYNKNELTIEDSGLEYDVSQEESYNTLVLNQTADNLVQAANNLLLSEDIKADNIKISLKKTDNNSIYISSINIYVSKEYKNRAEDIIKIIGSNMSKDPVVILNE